VAHAEAGHLARLLAREVRQDAHLQGGVGG
jgi:hypothetical protein